MLGRVRETEVEHLHAKAKNFRYQDRIELLQGTLDRLMLRVLQPGPQHGHRIIRAIQAGSRQSPASPQSVTLEPAPPITVTLNGYGVAFVALAP